MKEFEKKLSSRRDFLTKTVPVCTVSCLAAESFLPYKAGDLGYAAVCWGDYNWASDFNPKIKLIRDKTLMQGHKFCNHKYIWTG